MKKQKDLFDEQWKSDHGLSYGGSDGTEVDLLEYPEMNRYTECAHGLYVELEGGLEKWETRLRRFWSGHCWAMLSLTKMGKKGMWEKTLLLL